MPDEISLATIRNVPVAKVGKARLWKGGERSFTEDQLRDAVRASSDPEVGPARLKLGHEHQLDTGEPSFGTYDDLRYDEEQQTIFADLKGVPMWLAKTLPTFYPNRSFEAVENLETKSGAYKLAFRAIGSLGIKMPAIKGLEDLKHWAGIEMPAGVTLNAAEGTETPAWLDTAIEPERETTAMDMREKLGLAKEATDEEVAAALDALKALADAGAPEALQKIKDDALAEATRIADEAAATKIAEAEAEAKRQREQSGLVVVEAAALDELKANAALGAEARAEQVTARRVALIDRKIKKGALAPASRDKLLANLEAGAIDEDTIEGLPDGILPIDSKLLGTEGDLEGGIAEDDDSWMLRLLHDDERAALDAAQKGA